MKLHAAQRVGRIHIDGNWEWTRDNREHDLPMFEKESPPQGLPTSAQAS